MKNFSRIPFGAFLYLSLPGLALAAEPSDCTTIRLDLHGGPFERMPIYEQADGPDHDTAMCYAIAASELIDAHRISSSAANIPLTAPLSVALSYKMRSGAERNAAMPKDPSQLAIQLIGFGEVADAITAASGKFLCDQQWLEKFDALTSPVMPSGKSAKDSHTASTRNFIAASFDQISRWEKLQAGLNSSSAKSDKAGEFCSDDLNAYFSPHSASSANLNDIAAAVRAALAGDDPTSKLKDFVEGLCESHRHVVSISQVKAFSPSDASEDMKKRFDTLVRQADEETDKDKKNEIENELDELGMQNQNRRHGEIAAKFTELFSGRNPVPFAIEYSPGVLQNTASEVSHASVVVGRQYDEATKTCNLLVRDSYGSSCVDGQGQPRYFFPCENGTISVPKDKLVTATESIVWIPSRDSPEGSW